MPVDIVTEGLSKTRILDMSNSFEADGAAVHRGIPYVYGVQLETSVAITAENSDGQLVDYRILRALDSTTTVAKTKYIKNISDPKHNKSMNISDPAKTVVALSEKNCDVYVQNLDNFLGAGEVIIRRKYKSSGTEKLKGVDFKFPNDEKLIGLIPVQGGPAHYTTEFIAITVVTSGDVTDGTVFTDAKWYRYLAPNSFRKKEWVGSAAGQKGDVVGSVNIDTFGFGRAAIYANTCAVCEKPVGADFPTGYYIWTASGVSPFTVELWGFNSSYELTLIDSVDGVGGISDGTYDPAKPGIWIENEVALIFSSDILYSYRRETLVGETGYEGTLTRLSPIIVEETFNTGGFDENSVTQLESDGTDFTESIMWSAGIYAKLVHGMLIKEGILRDLFDKSNLMYNCEIIPKGYGIYFRQRDNTSVATIPFGHLGAVEGSDEAEGAKVTHSRVMDNELPTKVTLTFQDPYRLYSETAVKASYNLTAIGSEEEINSPVFVTKSEVDTIAQNILRMRWAERDTFEFDLPFTYANLEPGDCVTITLPFDTGETTVSCRIVKMKHSANGIITLQVTATGNLVYTDYDTVSETPPDDIDDPDPDLIQSGNTVLLDIPIVFDIYEDEYAVPVIVSTVREDAPWAGAKIKTYDTETSDVDNYTNIVDFPSSTTCTVGNVKNALSSSDCTVRETGTTMTIDFTSPDVTLDSIDDPFNDDSTLFAYGSELRGWEICKYTDAVQTDVDLNTWEISGFLRGLYGTEYLTGTHEVDDLFVLLSTTQALEFNTSIANSIIGTEFYTRAVCSGEAETDVFIEPCTYNGVNFLPYSGVHAAATRSGGDITLTWIPRSRIDNEWEDSVDVPVGEDVEDYEVDIMDGATVVRTKTSSNASVVYTSAQQTTDFGSPQSSVTFRIYQISAVVGRGTVYEVTL